MNERRNGFVICYRNILTSLSFYLQVCNAFDTDQAKYQQLNNTNIPINFNTRVSINDVNLYNVNEDSEKMHK